MAPIRSSTFTLLSSNVVGWLNNEDFREHGTMARTSWSSKTKSAAELLRYNSRELGTPSKPSPMALGACALKRSSRPAVLDWSRPSLGIELCRTLRRMATTQAADHSPYRAGR